MRYQFFAALILGLLFLSGNAFTAFAGGTKEEDFKTVSGTESWDYRYDISSLSPGKYNLIIRGTDKAGNPAFAGPFNVYVDPTSDLPVARVTTPAPGQRVGGDLTVVGTCVDDDGVDRVEVRLDQGDFAKAEGKDYWSLSLPVGSIPDGPHTISARGVDINGVTGTVVTVKFNLDTRAPLIRMTSHESGALAQGTLSLAGVVEDANGVRSLAYSVDDRATFLPLGVQEESNRTRARFTLGVDTRKLQDGPHVYWFRAGDLTGSIGTMPFLFFVDNTGPIVDILSPAPGAKSAGVVTIVGKITERVGIKSLSWNAGELGSGPVDLVPGDPYWVQDVDLGKAKGSSARVVFTAVDNAGNRAVRELVVALPPDESDLPVVTLRAPLASSRFTTVIPLVGTARDDDGVASIAYSLDGKPPVSVESTGAFATSLPGVLPGKHRLAVHGVDVNARAGKDVLVDFLVTGNPPLVGVSSVSAGSTTEQFRTGHEVSRSRGAVLHGTVTSFARIASIAVTFNGAAGEKPVVRQGTVPGQTLFDVKVPATVPFGLVTALVAATDEYGQGAENRVLLHVTNESRRITEPGVQFNDARIRADGTVALGPGGTLAGIMAGEEIGTVSLEPPTDIVTVAAEEDRIVVSAARSGVSEPVRVKVVTKKGHSFRSDALRFDTGTGSPPAVALTAVIRGKDTRSYTPGLSIVIGTGTVLSGTVAVPPAVKSAEYALSSGQPRSLPLRKAEKADVSTFEIPLPADLPHGRVDLRISVTDSADRRTDFLSFFYRVEPETGGTADEESVSFVDARIGAGGVVLLAPGEILEGYFNGRPIAAAVLEPETPLLKVSFEGNTVRVTPVGEGTKEGVKVRVTTVDGDAFLSGALSFHCDAAPPELAVTEPLVGSWTGARVTLKGTAADSGGLASVEYSVGTAGAFVAVPAVQQGGAFETVVDLAENPDGDVPITLRARDIAGRTTELALVVLKDTGTPTVAMLAPPVDEPVNGIVTLAGAASDAGMVDKVELSLDGKSWTTLPGKTLFSARVDLSKLPPRRESAPGAAAGPPAGAPGGVSFRMTDKAGNTVVIAPTLNVQQAADVPDLEVQVPQEGDVQRNDFVVSGTVFDDDGVGAILYRIDGGEYVRLPGSHSFSIPVALADITDNEHSIEVMAEDLNGVPSAPRKTVVRVSKAEPVSRLAFPALSSTARGVVTLAGESSDRNAIADVSLSFDNGQTYRRADGGEKWTYRLDTQVLKDGTYSVLIRAVDGYGTVGFASTLLNIDNTPPDIVVDEPQDGAALSRSFTLAGRARDDIAVTALSARLRPLGSAADPRVIELPKDGPFAQAVDIAGLAPGWYDLSVEGVDRAANSSIVSRNIQVEPGSVGERIDILFPGNGESLHGPFTVSGRLVSVRTPQEIALVVNGKQAGTAELKEGGYYTATAVLDELADGTLGLAVEARFADGPALRSENRAVAWQAAGPWVRVSSHSPGDWVNGRPFIRGEAGRVPDAGEASEKEDARKKRAEERRLVRVEISLDNGKSFTSAQGTQSWRYRLESQELPDGPVRILVKASYADGATAVTETILRLDDTPPQVHLLSPREEGRFNGEIVLSGTAADENGVSTVRAAVRKGDKSSYEVPGFIQGLYFDAHVLGATDWDIGAGLSFFDQNVKLQAQVGMAPEGRFSGLMLGAKLLANIVRLPFSYFLGPDMDFLSLSFAIGANFSYVTNSGSAIAFTDQGLILGAVVAQLEFPIFRMKSWPAFNTWSTYTEFQLWFISSDVSAGFVTRLAFGVRVGLF